MAEWPTIEEGKTYATVSAVWGKIKAYIDSKDAENASAITAEAASRASDIATEATARDNADKTKAPLIDKAQSTKVTGATSVHDLSASTTETLLLEANGAITLPEAPATGSAKEKMLLFKQTGAGKYVPTFTSVKWLNEEVPPWAEMAAGTIAGVIVISAPDADSSHWLLAYMGVWT
jgi:hypothetical protein